jgi:hypothetical protein
MEGHSWLFFELFENSHFWPFGGHFWVKIDPKMDILTKSERIFCWWGAYIFWDLQCVYWGYFKGYVKFGAEIRIFSTLNWT